LMMDHEIRRSGLAGNMCALVYELESSPDVDVISSRCKAFIARFPDTNVRLRQKGRRYYWERNGDPNPAVFFRHSAKSRDEALETIGKIINVTTPADAVAPIEFHLVEMAERAFFMMRWFHPICDAKGAELVVWHLLGDAEPSDGVDAFGQLTSKWGLWKKLGMIFRAKRHISALDKTASSLPKTIAIQADRLDFHIVRIDAETSKVIMARAMKEAGMTGIALYFIGCLMRALEKAGCDEKEGFCVPYAMNMRKRKALFPMLGNQVSFLFAQAKLEEVRDRKKLFQALREQHKATVRSGLDHALVPLMQAGSWLSLEKYGRIIRNTGKGQERSSFWFSYTGEADPKVSEIAGAKVMSMFQLSQVTAPPSLAILVSQFNGCITLSFNYVSSQIDRQWLESLTGAMSAELKGEETDT